MAPEITLMTKRGAEPLMSKRIFLDEMEKARSDGSSCLMVRGTATPATPAPAFTAKIIWPAHIITTRPDLAVALLWGWYQQALPHQSGPLCLDGDADLIPPTAPGAWLLVSGAFAPAGRGLITGACKSYSARSDDDLLRDGLAFLKRPWPGWHERSPATPLREARHA